MFKRFNDWFYHLSWWWKLPVCVLASGFIILLIPIVTPLALAFGWLFCRVFWDTGVWLSGFIWEFLTIILG